MKFKALILTVILLTGSAAAQKSGPAQMVRAFYKFNSSRQQTFNDRELKARKPWFSAELNRLFLNELQREKEFLKKNPTDKPHFGDGFPFVPSDECFRMGTFYPHRIVSGAAKTEGGRSTVEVKFYLSKVCGGDLITSYKVELIRTNGRWLIDDWIFDGAERLTDDLKRAEY